MYYIHISNIFSLVIPDLWSQIPQLSVTNELNDMKYHTTLSFLLSFLPSFFSSLFFLFISNLFSSSINSFFSFSSAGCWSLLNWWYNIGSTASDKRGIRFNHDLLSFQIQTLMNHMSVYQYIIFCKYDLSLDLLDAHVITPPNQQYNLFV